MKTNLNQGNSRRIIKDLKAAVSKIVNLMIRGEILMRDKNQTNDFSPDDTWKKKDKNYSNHAQVIFSYTYTRHPTCYKILQ